MARLRVMTWNIQSNANPRWDARAVARAIDDADPDVVGLQEVCRGRLDGVARHLHRHWPKRGLGDRDVHVAMAPTRPHDSTAPPGDPRSPAPCGGATGPAKDYGIAILARTPLEDFTSVELPAYGEPRRIAAATLPAAAGLRFCVLHASPAHAATEPQLAAAARRVAELGGPQVVVGDLNARPDDPAVGATLGAHLAEVDPSSAPTYPNHAGAAGPTAKIDYIFHSAGGVACAGAEVVPLPSGVSDHFPLVADLVIDDG
jgi:endonuclease/exonuclease/phosphatase family metal-dependent hydrolase